MARNYILRNLSDEQAADLTRASARAKREQRSLKAVILRFLHVYGLGPTVPAPRPRSASC